MKKIIFLNMTFVLFLTVQGSQNESSSCIKKIKYLSEKQITISEIEKTVKEEEGSRLCESGLASNNFGPGSEKGVTKLYYMFRFESGVIRNFEQIGNAEGFIVSEVIGKISQGSPLRKLQPQMNMNYGDHKVVLGHLMSADSTDEEYSDEEY